MTAAVDDYHDIAKRLRGLNSRPPEAAPLGPIPANATHRVLTPRGVLPPDPANNSTGTSGAPAAGQTRSSGQAGSGAGQGGNPDWPYYFWAAPELWSGAG